MLQIIRVDTLDHQTLDIELNNGHIILFDMEKLLKQNPVFLSLQKQEVLPCPKTDGISLLWKGGERLWLSDIINMLQEDKK
ncbi:MAG: hypothetical protein ACERKZ_21570 [Lachnotalea sp.]